MALLALDNMGDSTSAPPYLTDPDDSIRAAATRCLRHAEADTAVPALAEALATDPAPSVRTSALEALRTHACSAGDQAVCDALMQESDSSLRMKMVSYLGERPATDEITTALKMQLEQESDSHLRKDIYRVLYRDGQS